MTQRCRCCGARLVWIGFSRLTCPAVACPHPTTIDVGPEQLELPAPTDHETAETTAGAQHPADGHQTVPGTPLRAGHEETNP
jgi:hypothetical protein